MPPLWRPGLSEDDKAKVIESRRLLPIAPRRHLPDHAVPSIARCWPPPRRRGAGQERTIRCDLPPDMVPSAAPGADASAQILAG